MNGLVDEIAEETIPIGYDNGETKMAPRGSVQAECDKEEGHVARRQGNGFLTCT
jgi:hypothetical protein